MFRPFYCDCIKKTPKLSKEAKYNLNGNYYALQAQNNLFTDIKSFLHLYWNSNVLFKCDGDKSASQRHRLEI